MPAVSLETLDGLKREWNSLLQRSSSNTVFSTWEWHSAWSGAFGRDFEPHLLAVRDSSRLIGIVPLVMRDGALHLMGGQDVSDYLDVIAERGSEEQVLSAMLSHLRTLKWDSLEMHFLRHTSPTLTLLPKMALQEGLVVTQEVDEVCPSCALPHDWEAYVNSLGKKERHELRRKMRRLNAQESLRWVAVSPADELPDDLDDFFRLCRLSTREKAFFMDQKMEMFFRSVVANLTPLGIVRLYFLELGGQRVSSAICFDQGRELWLYNSGYDPAYSSLSVGLLLKAYCIKDAIERRKTRFDFLRGAERYKYDLGGRDVPVFGLRITPQ